MPIKPPYIKPFKPAPDHTDAGKDHTDEANVKKKNPYDPQYFWKINYSELLADGAIIAYAFYFSQYFFKGNNILNIIKPWQLIGLYALVSLTLPWYLGYLYAHWDEFYKKIINKIVKWVFIAIVLASLVYLLVIAMSVPWDSDKTDRITENFGMFSLFLLVLGPMMSIGGFTAGQDDCEKPKSSDYDPNNPSVTSVLMIIVMAIGFLVWWANSDVAHNHSWLVIFIYFGSCLAAVIVYALYMGLMMFLNKIGVYKMLTSMAAALFPLFIVGILILWNEIGMRLIFSSDKNAYASISFGRLIFILTVSGFIPFRLIMIFTPPLRLINLLIGLVAFACYFYNIRMLCL